MMTQSTTPIVYNYYPTNASGTIQGTDEDTLEKQSTTDVSQLGKDDFMTLLIAELQNQDPLDPASNTEFVAQLAQFSSLEQMTSMNETLGETLESNKSMAQSVSNAMIVNYFGKSVTAESDAFSYDGDGEKKVQFELGGAANYGTIKILDEDENIVDYGALYELEKGAHEFDWDGLTSLGVQAPEGKYTLVIEAYDSFGEKVTVTPLITGTVDGVSYKDGKTNVVVGGVQVPYDKVRSITEAD
jgi:flagellar basal-body rod modification protein FlgD